MPGGIAPLVLHEYEIVKSYRERIKEVTRDRIMPPWGADNSGSCQTFSRARWLSQTDINTLAAWADAGAPEGKPKDDTHATPKPLVLNHVSVTLDPGASYTPSAAAEDESRCYVIDPQLAVDRYLTGFEVKPGSSKMVHHVTLYSPTSIHESQIALAKDSREGGAGYACHGGPGVDSQMVAGWEPGMKATLYPERTGLLLEAGRNIIVEVHYRTTNGVESDRTTVDLQLQNSVPLPGTFIEVAAMDLVLSPGQARATAVGRFDLASRLATGTTQVWGVFPHMHERGRQLRIETDETCLGYIPRWDFDWQQLFFYEAPVRLTQRDREVRITCTFDTTLESAPIYWGESTKDEMCRNYFYVTP